MGAREALLVLSEDFAGIARWPQLLSMAGLRVSVQAPAGARILSSSHVARSIEGPAEAEAALDFLKRRLDAGARYDWIVLADQPTLRRAAERAGEAWLAALLPARLPAEEASVLFSKTAFSRAMARAGVAMPPGRAAVDADGVREAAAALGYPVIVKPVDGSAGRGIFIARSSAELDAASAGLAGERLVERLVDGDVGTVAILYDTGKPLWWASYANRAAWPPPFGPGCRRQALQPPDLETLLEGVGAALRLHGLVDLNWVSPKGGPLAVIDFNARLIAIVPDDEQAATLPAVLRDWLDGKPRRNPPPPSKEARIRHTLPASFQLACARNEWGLAVRLLLGLAGPTDTPWDDLGLLKQQPYRLAKAVYSAWLAP